MESVERGGEGGGGGGVGGVGWGVGYEEEEGRSRSTLQVKRVLF